MKINKVDLQEALEIVKPGLANKEMIEQSTSFAFMEGRVVTYNDEISISHPVKGLEIEGAVQAEELYQLLSKIKKDEIDMITQDNEIILKSGRMKAGLILHQEIKLPLEEIGELSKWKGLPENFISGIKFSMAACSKEMSKPVLTCVHVNQKGYVEGSDGFCIARYPLKKKIGIKTFLLPSQSATELVRLNPTKIAEGEGWVHFQTDEKTVMSCRIFEDEFPDCDSFLKVEGKEIVFPKTIGNIMNRAVVFSKRDQSLEENIEVILEDNRLEIKSHSDSGWFEETANIKYEETPISFFITPYLLKNIISEIQTCVLGKQSMKFESEEKGWIYVVALK